MIKILRKKSIDHILTLRCRGRAHDGWDQVCHLSVEGQMVCQVGRDLGDRLTWLQ